MKLNISITQELNASKKDIWAALTQSELMKSWYFDLPNFTPTVGYQFNFLGGADPQNPYNHLCEIIEAEPEKILAYTWRYEGYPGNSLVKFEIIETADYKNAIRLSHAGIESFGDNPDLQVDRFEKGWNAIIHESLVNYFKKK